VIRCAALIAVMLAGLALTGCGSGGSTGETVANESALQPVKQVSPACEEARETLRFESSNPQANPTYLREDKEVVAEECGAVARARWSKTQFEQTPEGEAQKAKEVEENAPRVEEEAKAVGEVLKKREAEQTANRIEGG
jgi:hypothetical protein